MGSCCFLQTPFSQSLPITTTTTPTTATSYSSSQCFLLRSHHLKTSTKLRPVSMASHRHQDQIDINFIKRRSILALGISVLPFLNLKATALEDLLKEERDTITLEEKQSAEKLHQGEAPPVSLLSLLNVVGIIGSGVLGALYTLAQQEKASKDTIIESLKSKLVEKDAVTVSLKKDFEERLLSEQEERARQNKKTNEEQHALSNQLTMANATIAGLRKEVQKEKRLMDELKTEIDKLQNEFVRSGENNKMLEEKLKEKVHSIGELNDRVNLLSLEVNDKEEKLQNINSLLNEKDSECTDLTFINKRANEHLLEKSTKIKSLEEELLKTQEDLNTKNSVIDDLNARITSLTTERDDINRNLKTLQEDYSNLRSSSGLKAESDAELLRKREHEIHQLEEKLRLVLSEVGNYQNTVANLSQERDDLKTLLKIEESKVKNLQHELQSTQEIVKTSSNEVVDLSEQLRKSSLRLEEVASENSKVQMEFEKVRGLLMSSLEEAKSNSEVLSSELASVKIDLEKNKEEFGVVSDKLVRMTETSEGLRKELLDVYKKAESATNDLKEEKNVVATLRKQLDASEERILKDTEARKSLEIDLEEATKSLDELNKNLLVLSKELNVANSSVENLEAEKDMLYNSLMEQKNLSKEARENIEDAHDIIMKLGKERENLDKRVKKLEAEVASAKGEILLLRSKKNTVNDLPKKKSTEVENDAVVSVKKGGRRKKNTVPSSENPK